MVEKRPPSSLPNSYSIPPRVSFPQVGRAVAFPRPPQVGCPKRDVLFEKRGRETWSRWEGGRFPRWLHLSGTKRPQAAHPNRMCTAIHRPQSPEPIIFLIFCLEKKIYPVPGGPRRSQPVRSAGFRHGVSFPMLPSFVHFCGIFQTSRGEFTRVYPSLRESPLNFDSPTPRIKRPA